MCASASESGLLCERGRNGSLPEKFTASLMGDTYRSRTRELTSSPAAFFLATPLLTYATRSRTSTQPRQFSPMRSNTGAERMPFAARIYSATRAKNKINSREKETE
jgi:hypothetical protein